ncbi:MAG TPA: hypothetical protein VE135_01320 [Pyrinomonadaceae bacterium]|nr:hypothetical protein [Pyrinomonadaceae bacterium]
MGKLGSIENQETLDANRQLAIGNESDRQLEMNRIGSYDDWKQ